MLFSKVRTRQKNTDNNVFVLLSAWIVCWKKIVMPYYLRVSAHYDVINQMICRLAVRWIKLPAILLTCYRTLHTQQYATRGKHSKKVVSTHNVHRCSSMHRYRPDSFTFTLSEVRRYHPFTELSKIKKREIDCTHHAQAVRGSYDSYYHSLLSNRLPRLVPYLNIQTRDLL